MEKEMKRLILMLALSIGASIALADSNPATYNTKTGSLDIPLVIVDDVQDIDRVITVPAQVYSKTQHCILFAFCSFNYSHF